MDHDTASQLSLDLRPWSSSDTRTLSPFPTTDSAAEALWFIVPKVWEILNQFMQVSHPQEQIVHLFKQAERLLEISQELREESDDPTSAFSLPLHRIHWDRLWHCINKIVDQCRLDTLAPLHESLKRITATREIAQHERKLLLPDDEVQWYQVESRRLQFQTETLRVLLQASKSLTGYVSDINKDNSNGEVSAATRDRISTLHSLTAVLKRKIDDAERYDISCQVSRSKQDRNLLLSHSNPVTLNAGLALVSLTSPHVDRPLVVSRLSGPSCAKLSTSPLLWLSHCQKCL
jgi:hypothetical protein